MARERRTKESTIKQAQGTTRLLETHKGVKNPDFSPKKFPGGDAELTVTPRQAGSCPSLDIGDAEKPVGVPPPRGLGQLSAPEQPRVWQERAKRRRRRRGRRKHRSGRTEGKRSCERVCC